MRFSAVLVVVSLAACAMPQRAAVDVNEELLVTGFPHLPADARGVAERLASCSHFYGEIGGDPDRDKQIMTILAELRCGTIDDEVGAMRSKYSGNKVVQDALDQAGNL